MINITSITDLKQNTANVIKKVRSSGDPILVMRRSQPAAVLLDPEYYKMLEEAFEDIADIRIIEKRKNEPTVPFAKYFEKRFKKRKK